MKLIYWIPFLTAAQAQFYGTCNTEVSKAYGKCIGVVSATTSNLPMAVALIQSLRGHLSICYGEWPDCNDLQKLALSKDLDCTMPIWRGADVNVQTMVRPCENPLPSRLIETQLCTANHFILSEFYGQLYTDMVRNNNNEHFTYNITSQTITAKSNGQCLQVVPNPQPSHGYGTVKTTTCDFSAANQKWTITSDGVFAQDGYYLRTENPFKRGAIVSVSPRSDGLNSNTYFADCNKVQSNYVRIVSTRGKRVSEYYSGLYFNDAADNMNELFTWDSSTQMFKSASAQQCLDSYLDSDGKYKIHTYACDANNANQKWIVHSDTKQIEHATHKGQCLDGDPTYADHHLQMWECIPNNINQQWNVETYTG